MPGRDLAGIADRIAEAARGCPHVVDLAAGPLATYLPGRTVAGVSIGHDRIRIEVVADNARPLAKVAAEVRAAVTPLTGDVPVDVVIADIVERQGA
jgi:hypothetical protein